MIAAENCNNIAEQTHQPKPLWHYAGCKLAQDYKTKSDADKKDLIQQWIATLPKEVWEKIYHSDPATFLRFEKCDWLTQKLNCNKENCSCERKWSSCGTSHQFSRSFALFQLMTHKGISNLRVYHLWNTQSKKLIRKIKSDSLGTDAFCFELSDTMLSWAKWRDSNVSVLDLHTYKTYQIKLPHYGAYAPSDMVCGVFYIFDQAIMVGDTSKSLKKVTSHLNDSGSYTLEHEIDITYFKSETPGIKLIQTNNFERFVLIDEKDVYCYDTVKGTIIPWVLDFTFDSVHANINPSLIIFYTKKRSDSPAYIRIFSTENLTEPQHVINLGNHLNYYERFHMLTGDQILFFHGQCRLFSKEYGSLQGIGAYNLCYEVPLKDKISLVYDADYNLYPIPTDVFTQQIEKNQQNQIKTIDPESLLPAYTQSAALLSRTFHHNCVIQ